MFGRKQTEVIVVGAGPVGLFTALCLTRRGVGVQIVDEAPRRAMHSYALALHGDSLNLLREHGLADDVIAESYPVRTVGLYDQSHCRAQMRLSDLPQTYPFVAVMQQDALEGVLERALKKAGVKIQWNHRMVRFIERDDDLLVTVDRMVRASVGYGVSHSEWMAGGSKKTPVAFLVGADGHRSLVRRQYETDYPECGAAQQFAVFEFETNADLQNEMRVVLQPKSTNVMWPLPGGFCRWSFEIDATPSLADTRLKDRLAVDLGGMRFPVLSEEFLRRLLSERAPWFTGSIGEIRWRMAVRFERRLAQSFGDNRVWLVGDAGHLTGPVAAQSMNVGLREADQIARAIAETLHDGARSEELNAYAAGRKQEWRGLLSLDGGLEAGPETDPWLLDYVDRLLPCIPGSAETLSELVTQLGVTWTHAAPETCA